MFPLNIAAIPSEVFSPSLTTERDLPETTDAFPHDGVSVEGVDTTEVTMTSTIPREEVTEVRPSTRFATLIPIPV